VRDAFWRLSQLGFLIVRPQRATTVSPISVADVRQARFIRTALEVETIRVATEVLDAADLAALAELIERQAEAVAAGARERFHALDEEFHRQLCERAGVGFTWALIREKKAHMDRVRYLSLAFNAADALAEHRTIMAALVARDAEAGAAAMRAHLARIDAIIARVRETHAALFAAEE
jgi:DNA-binding GntR family transcriptional regulator